MGMACQVVRSVSPPVRKVASKLAVDAWMGGVTGGRTVGASIKSGGRFVRATTMEKENSGCLSIAYRNQ
jgi:hypothetical protein